ncbi:MAG: thioredoxin family protein [Desulfobacteraceae bacterium]|nr:thioredoxin family protein [Desulfobacteraceae bacterium]
MTLITSQDEHTIRLWAAEQEAAFTLQLVQDESPIGQKIAQFCHELHALLPQVQIRKGPDEPFRKPAIIFGRHGNIAYQALPAGKELPPFLQALGLSGAASPTPESQGTPIELPAELTLFISAICPHCPQAADRLLHLADATPPLRLTIIDGTLFPDLAEANAIRSVPTLILDSQLRWTGQFDMAEVIRQCAQRDPSKLSAASLRQIIENGEAARVADLMSQCDQIFPAFIDLLTHARWSIRLGAMVAVEYLCDQSPDLASRLIEPLWRRFDQMDEPVQGDAVQVLAQINTPQARQCLKHIASSTYSEAVKEAAMEELGNSAS